jgi:hypothetical protein
MKREVIDCDRCGKECDQHIHIDIPNGTERESDPAGGHSSVYHLYEKKDLCPECAGKLLGYMFRMKKLQKIEDGRCVEGQDKWLDGRNVHPSCNTNDAVALALKWFKINPKE